MSLVGDVEGPHHELSQLLCLCKGALRAKLKQGFTPDLVGHAVFFRLDGHQIFSSFDDRLAEFQAPQDLRGHKARQRL